MADMPVSLAERRAMDADNAKLWTPLDALKRVIRDIESGAASPDMVYIAMAERRPDGLTAYPYCAAGTNDLETIGLLHAHLLLTAPRD